MLLRQFIFSDAIFIIKVLILLLIPSENIVVYPLTEFEAGYLFLSLFLLWYGIKNGGND